MFGIRPPTSRSEPHLTRIFMQLPASMSWWAAFRLKRRPLPWRFSAALVIHIDKAFGSLSERRVGALLLGADAFYGNHIQKLVSLAAHHKMPAMYYRREFAEAGGLASYGASNIDAYRQVGVYVARVLKGEKPGELPVMQAAKFEFVLNLRTARALGIEVPMAFSAAADEIIE
jgi:putative tryptophan/tyrosine transport system substrate-binding protein